MSTSPARAPSLTRPAKLFELAQEWARTEGKTWVYLFKALCASLVALGISMRLDLAQPRTAMTTTFIVMQAQSGAVFAKSFYRICGTVIGLVVMLVLISLFSQTPELFILSTATWVGICTVGAARNRNFRSYGFVLAGYTAALIGFPSAQHPEAAFMTATTRVAEVVIGIICAGAVSALIFPSYVGDAMWSSVRTRFHAFVTYVSTSFAGKIDRSDIEAATARLAAEVVGFESARSMAVFESPKARMRGGRLKRLNSEFMTASTRFHALHQLLIRLQRSGSVAVVAAFEPYLMEVSPLLAQAGAQVLGSNDANYVIEKIEVYKESLRGRMLVTRAEPATLSAADLLEFDTASELLYRFLDDFHSYSSTLSSLAVDTHERERWPHRYVPKTNMLVAAIGGLRAVATILIVGAFWIETAWPSGVTALLNAAVVCALAASSPRPTRMIFQMTGGTLLAIGAALATEAFVYPSIDGFAMLCVAMTPFLLCGLYLTTRPSTFGYGFGYCVFFSTLVGPDNVIHYDPAGLMNDGLALLFSMVVSFIAFAVLLPASTPWLRKKLLGDLRRQVLLVCNGRDMRLRSRFESGARDILFQLDSLAALPGEKSQSVSWLFAVLEVGNVVIDLRRESVALSSEPESAPSAASRRSLSLVFGTVASLFQRPDATRLECALKATTAASADVEQLLVPCSVSLDVEIRFRRILCNLHLLRAALLDPQSPLSDFRGVTAGCPSR